MVRESQSPAQPYQPRAKKSTSKPSKALRFSSPNRPRPNCSIVSPPHNPIPNPTIIQLLSPGSSVSGYGTGSLVSAVGSGLGQDELKPSILSTPSIFNRRPHEHTSQEAPTPPSLPPPRIGQKTFGKGKGIRITGRSKKYRTKNLEVLRQIRALENAQGIREAIPTRSFQRQVKLIVGEQHWDDYKFQAGALRALQQASEALLISLFEDMNLCSQHDHRVTVMPRDMVLSRRLRRNM